MYERGCAQLTYVDGALPWVAKIGDISQFIDLIDMPLILDDRVPQRLSVEWVATKEGRMRSRPLSARMWSPTS